MEIQNEEKQKIANSAKNKTIIAVLVIAGIIIGWELGIRAYMGYIRPYFSGMAYRNYVDSYIQAQLNDKIGGDTPEETVDLFIEALKKGDYDLASKYFVIDEQERWREKFKRLTKEELDIWIKNIEDNKKNWRKEQQGEGQFVFKYNTGEGENEKTHSIVLQKNINNKWKIGSF